MHHLQPFVPPPDDQRLRRLARDFDDSAAGAALAAGERRAGLWLREIDRERGDNWLASFVDSPRAAELGALDLAHNHLTSRGAALFARLRQPSRLRELRLDHNPLGADGIVALAEARFLARQLVRLSLRGVQEHGPCTFAHLLGQPWPTLEVLDLGDNPLADAALVAMVERGHFPRLRALHLDHTVLTDDGLAALARAGERLPALARLELGGDFVRPGSIAALLRAPGPTRLEHLGLGATRLSDAALEDLAAEPALARLSSLDLASNRFGSRAVERLAASPHAAGLRRLSLADNELDRAALEALTAPDTLPRLEHLDLAATALDDTGVARLCRAAFRTGLRELVLARNPLGDAALERLARTDWPALERLDLGFVRASATGYDALAHAPWLARLEWLRLEGTTPDAARLTPRLAAETRAVLGAVRLDAPGLVALLESPCSRHLEALTLFRWGEPPVRRHLTPEAQLAVIWEPSPAGFCALARSPGLRHLHALGVHYAGLGTDEVAALVASPWIDALLELDLSHHDRLGPDAARALARWPGLGHLQRLALSYTSLGVDGVAALAAARHVRALRVLELAYAGVDDAALSALCTAPWLDGVQELGLWSTGLVTDLGARVLAECAHARNLRVLDLRGAALGDDGVRALLDSPWLQGLHRLRLAHDLHLDNATRHELLRRRLVTV